MTSVRRSVEQTVTRLVTRTLRERAQAAGTPAARPDAPQALAALLDHVLPESIAAAGLPQACERALAYGFGCIVVPLGHAAVCVDRVSGSGMRVGVRLAHDREIELALDAGVAEIEIPLPAGLRQRPGPPEGARDDDLHEYLVTLRGRTNGTILKLDLSAGADDALLGACAHAATAGVDLVLIPPHLIADAKRTLNPTTGIKIAAVASLETARQLLSSGATRLGTSDGPALIDAAKADTPGSAPAPS